MRLGKQMGHATTLVQEVTAMLHSLVVQAAITPTALLPQFARPHTHPIEGCVLVIALVGASGMWRLRPVSHVPAIPALATWGQVSLLTAVPWFAQPVKLESHPCQALSAV